MIRYDTKCATPMSVLSAQERTKSTSSSRVPWGPSTPLKFPKIFSLLGVGLHELAAC